MDMLMKHVTDCTATSHENKADVTAEWDVHYGESFALEIRFAIEKFSEKLLFRALN